MADDELRSEQEMLAHKINAMNPSQIEIRLALEPGGPESLEEAARRVLAGEPVIQPDPGMPVDEAGEPIE